MLVYDSFEGHVTENVKVVFAKENSNNYLALLPHRLTRVLQPIVFLEQLRSRMQWIADHIHDFTEADRLAGNSIADNRSLVLER